MAAVAALPQFQRTRAGVAEGLEAELPGSSSAKGWALAAAGGLAGGASGWVISSAMIGRIAQHSSLAGYARVPGAVMGAVFSAFLGAELAEPAAVAGKRAGSVFRLGFEVRAQREGRLDIATMPTMTRLYTPAWAQGF